MQCCVPQIDPNTYILYIYCLQYIGPCSYHKHHGFCYCLLYTLFILINRCSQSTEDDLHDHDCSSRPSRVPFVTSPSFCQIRILSRLIPSSQAVTTLKMKTMVLASPQVCRHFGHLQWVSNSLRHLQWDQSKLAQFAATCQSTALAVDSKSPRTGFQSTGSAVGPKPAATFQS
jgi:hypothetical protein